MSGPSLSSCTADGVDAVTHCMQEGSVHNVKVIRMMDFGAIVEFPSGSSSLLHISQISHTRVSFCEHMLHWPLC